MIEKHVVVLEAQDKLTPAFQKAGRAAEDAATKGKRSAEDWSRAAQKVGIAIGGLVTATSYLGRAHQSESNQIKALERAYGDQADQLDDLAQSYQAMGIASDDSVRIAALGAQSLAKNYGLTADEITQLIERSADLSAVTFDQYGNQLQLADVMQRVTGAIRGEGEAAEILGVAMSDSRLASLAAAEGLTGWTTTMTESEKAAFRLKVLLNDTTSAQGAAAEKADTLAGKTNALKLQLLDQASAVGGLLGPLGEMAAVLGDVALAAPLVGGALGKMAGSMSAAKLSTTVLGVGLGPLGLGLAALGGAAGLTYLIQKMNDYEDAAEAATIATGDLNNFFKTMAEE